MTLKTTPAAVRTPPADTKLVICVQHPFPFWTPPPSLAEALQRRWPQMKVVQVLEYGHLPTELAEADIFVGYSLRPHQFAHARKLKWIHSTAAGVSQLMYPDLCNSGVILTNPSGIFSPSMAEHTMGLLIALARNLRGAIRYQERRQWAQEEMWKEPPGLEELNGRLLLIVGFGSIGRELARRARAFRMRIWGVTRSGEGDLTLAERILPGSRLEEALPEADYMVLSAPETPETRQLIGAAQLARMKPSARLVNISRGSLIDEGALVRALQAGKLAGAALDVAADEPLPPESALWTAPNLLLTPHVSAVSDRLWERHTALLIELLERWFDGRELLNRVDFARGY
jgi:phosphoglycerate dehydrogenase-like enzyme